MIRNRSNSERTIIIKIIFIIIVSLIYANWMASLPNSIFRDRDNYMVYASIPFKLLARAISSGSFLFKEPLFLLLNQGLLSLHNDPAKTVHILVFFTTFCTSFYAFYRANSAFGGLVVILFLFIQVQSLGLQLVTLRQGICAGILLLLIHKRSMHLLSLLLLCGFIHNSFFVFAAFYGMQLLLGRHFGITSNRAKSIYIAIFGLFFFSMFSVLSSLVATKQNLETIEVGDASGGGGAFIVWLIVLFYLLAFKTNVGIKEKNDANRNIYNLAIIGLLIYLTGYFLTPIVGRMIGVFIPFIIMALLHNFKVRDVFFIALVFGINFYLYLSGSFEGVLTVSLDSFHHELFSWSL